MGKGLRSGTATGADMRQRLTPAPGHVADYLKKSSALMVVGVSFTIFRKVRV